MLCLDVLNHERLAAGQDASGQHLGLHRQRQPDDRAIVAEAAGGNQAQDLAVAQQDAGAVEVDEALQLLEHLGEDQRRIQGGTDGAGDLLERRGEAAPLLLGGKEPGVLDGDPRLVGDGTEQLQVLFVEPTRLGVDDGQHADDAHACHQGNGDRRARVALALAFGPPQPARVVRRRLDQRRLAMLDHPPGQTPFEGVGQLFGRVVVDLAAVRQGPFQDAPLFGKDQNAPAGGADRLERKLQNVLEELCADRAAPPARG